MAEKCHFPRAPAGKNKFIFRDEIMFDSDFDSGNLDTVVDCGSSDYNYEFNLWTALDCAGTPYENPNRTWFYFSIRGGIPGSKMLLNVVNLNKQCKLYQQGMSPVIKQVPGKCGWERMRDRPAISVGEFGMKLSFFHSVTPNHRAATYYAFCFPHSYSDCQKRLERIEAQLATSIVHDSIYYHRELLTRSLDGRRIDLITISSNRGITRDREPRLSGICPSDEERPNVFLNKQVYFLSARVHPGEVTSSHLFNGFLDFILRPDDLRAKALRDLFVFKLVPLVNPDGVARGHYRVDQRGVNLNRMYLNPDPLLHPSVFAIKAVILHHHTRGVITSKKKLKSLGHSINRTPHTTTDTSSEDMFQCSTTHEEILTPENEFTEHLLPELQMHKNFTGLWNDSSFSHLSIKSISEKDFNIISSPLFMMEDVPPIYQNAVDNNHSNNITDVDGDYYDNLSTNPPNTLAIQKTSGVAFYVDLHGHAVKRGCFIYGNYFEDIKTQAENMLYSKLISLNSPNFDFSYCLFSEKNMYFKDKREGFSKEGSGRVGIYKTTGILRSYTVECNYNTGKLCNTISPADPSGKTTPPTNNGFPPKFTPPVFEELGRSLAVAALDLFNANPWSRLKKSSYGSLQNVRTALLEHVCNMRSIKKETCLTPISNSAQSNNGGTKITKLASEDHSSMKRTNTISNIPKTVAIRSKSDSSANQYSASINPRSSLPAKQSKGCTHNDVTVITSKENKTKINPYPYIPSIYSKEQLIAIMNGRVCKIQGPRASYELIRQKLNSLSYTLPLPSSISSHDSSDCIKDTAVALKQYDLQKIPCYSSKSDITSSSAGNEQNNKIKVNRAGIKMKKYQSANLNNNLDSTVNAHLTSNSASLAISVDFTPLVPRSNNASPTHQLQLTPNFSKFSPSRLRITQPLSQENFHSQRVSKSRCMTSNFRLKRGNQLAKERKKAVTSSPSDCIEGKMLIERYLDNEEINIIKRLPRNLQERALTCLRDRKYNSSNTIQEKQVSIKNSNKKDPYKKEFDDLNNSLMNFLTEQTLIKKQIIKGKPKLKKSSNMGLSRIQPTATSAVRFAKGYQCKIQDMPRTM